MYILYIKLLCEISLNLSQVEWFQSFRFPQVNCNCKLYRFKIIDGIVSNKENSDLWSIWLIYTLLWVVRAKNGFMLMGHFDFNWMHYSFQRIYYLCTVLDLRENLSLESCSIMMKACTYFMNSSVMLLDSVFSRERNQKFNNINIGNRLTTLSRFFPRKFVRI